MEAEKGSKWYLPQKVFDGIRKGSIFQWPGHAAASTQIASAPRVDKFATAQNKTNFFQKKGSGPEQSRASLT
jgi:hypothetical protein